MSNDLWRDGLFESFTELVEIRVGLQPLKVPENNKLLRCFQYVRTERVSVGDYCWNGDCSNCSRGPYDLTNLAPAFVACPRDGT